jgi:hypothetical protein
MPKASNAGSLRGDLEGMAGYGLCIMFEKR